MTDGARTPNDPVEISDGTKPRRKRRTGLWLGIGIPGGLLVAGAVASSMVLIAPGVAVAGTPVGFHTAGAATQAIEERIAGATVEIGGAEITGKELGASVDAEEVAAKAFEDHPLWKISDWNPEDPYAPTVAIDRDKAIDALKDKGADLFIDPVDAKVEFTKGAFAAVDAKPGSGPDLDALATDLSTALVEGEGGIEVTASPVEIAATTSTDAAKAEAKSLNKLAEGAGFYVGDKLAVGVDAKQLASWLDVVPDGEGGFSVTAKTSEIQHVVKTLQKKVDRAAKDVTQIVDTEGNVLQGDEGKDGWKLKGTDGVAEAFASALEKGENHYQLDTEIVEAKVTKKERRLEVDTTALKAYAYENDRVVKTFPVSPGKPGTDTDPGHFKTYVKLVSQDMGREDTTKAPYYFTPDVPYVMYFNGSEGFHGAYWHNEFGIQPMSHGCVNMRVGDAKWLFDWTPVGTDVWVHS